MSMPHEQRFPPIFLWAAAGMIFITMVVSFVGRHAGIGVSQMPKAVALEVHQVRFMDQADGSIASHPGEQNDALGTPFYVIAPETGGFVRGVIRGFNRERKRRGIDRLAPFRLSRMPDGRLMVGDPATGLAADLGAFGEANYSVFRELFEAAAAQSIEQNEIRTSNDFAMSNLP